MRRSQEKFRTVSLPRILTDVAEEMIKSGKYGYRNLPDYICELLRKDLRGKEYIKG